MSGTFDMPVLINQIGDNRFMIYRNSEGEVGSNSKLYRVTGDLGFYVLARPSNNVMTRKEIETWFEQVRGYGCNIVEIPTEGWK